MKTKLCNYDTQPGQNNVAEKHETGATERELKATKCGRFRLGPRRLPTWSGPAPG